MSNIKKRKILFLVNVDWFFLSHRLPIALEALRGGAEVWVVTADTGYLEEIESYGFKTIDFPFSRSGTNYLRELFSLAHLYRVYSRIKPDLVHHVTIKPVIYGSIIARFFKNLFVINAITGMGFVFSKDKKASGIKSVVRFAYRTALNNKNARVIFQNEEDRRKFVNSNLVKNEQTNLIRGSGVDTNVFKPLKEDSSHNVSVLLASRMIWDKGIREFVEAADIVRQKRLDVRFILAGKVDDGNPNMVSVETLKSWEDQNKVEWLGHHEDMIGLLQSSTIIALPTFYPEGVPKILIEAASMGKPIITTDRPGCRDIVKNGENGILIPEKDSRALADAILYLLQNPDICQKFGKKGRQLVIDEFSEEKVVSETMDLYDEMLGKEWRLQKHCVS